MGTILQSTTYAKLLQTPDYPAVQNATAKERQLEISPSVPAAATVVRGADLTLPAAEGDETHLDRPADL